MLVSPAPLAHSPQLDGMRFFAFFAVFVAHTLIFTIDPDAHPWIANGVRGVTVFFVLSGYLIGRGLLVQRESGATFRELIRGFYVRRALRIFPLYYAVILAIVLLRGVLELPYPNRVLPWDLTYLANLRIFLDRSWKVGAGHFWTLSVEEHFYLLAPVVLLLASRRAVARGCALVIALVVMARCVIGVRGITPWVVVLSPLHFDALCMGIVAAIVDLDGSFLGLSRRAFVRVGLVAAFLFVFVVWARSAAPPAPDGRVARVAAVTLADACLAAASAGAVLALADRRTIFARVLAWRPLAYGGKVSYCLYLVHPFCLFFVQKDQVMVHAFGVFGASAIAFLATVVIATASWFGFERPILGLKGRLAPPPAARHAAP